MQRGMQWREALREVDGKQGRGDSNDAGKRWRRGEEERALMHPLLGSGYVSQDTARSPTIPLCPCIELLCSALAAVLLRQPHLLLASHLLTPHPTPSSAPPDILPPPAGTRYGRWRGGGRRVWGGREGEGRRQVERRRSARLGRKGGRGEAAASIWERWKG